MVFEYDVGIEFEIVCFFKIVEAVDDDLYSFPPCEQGYPVEDGAGHKMWICRFIYFIAASSHSLLYLIWY